MLFKMNQHLHFVVDIFPLLMYNRYIDFAFSKGENALDKPDLLDLISTFNISARYPDYRKTFYQKCTHEYTKARIDEINEVRTWLLNLIK